MHVEQIKALPGDDCAELGADLVVGDDGIDSINGEGWGDDVRAREGNRRGLDFFKGRPRFRTSSDGGDI